MEYNTELEELARKIEEETSITYKRSRRDSSSNTLVYLITNSPEIDGEPLFVYLKRNYPDITIGDTDIVEWAEPILSAFGEAINSGDEENLVSNIQFGCNLMAAGAKENSDGVVLANAIQKGFKIGEKTAIEYAKAHPEQTIDGMDASDWVNKCYEDNFRNFNFYSNDIADLMLASNLLAAGAISGQVETERLVNKLIENNLNIGDQSAASWAIDNSIGGTNLKLKGEVLEKQLKEKYTAVASDFDEAGAKDSGYSTGSKIKSKDEFEVYLKKPALKSTEGLDRSEGSKGYKLILENRDLNAEYVLGSIFHRLLLTQTPDIRMIVEDSEFGNLSHQTKDGGRLEFAKVSVLKESESQLPEVSITSRFLKKFSTLNDFAETPEGSKLGSSPKVRKIKGFEKVMAALWVMGDPDCHSFNLGVSNIGTEAKPEYLAVKIDHGRAGLRILSNAKTLQKVLVADFVNNTYFNVPFNVEKLKQAMDEVVRINESELENMMKSRVANLDAVGFKVDNKMFHEYLLDDDPDFRKENTTDQKGVVEVYMARIKQNIAVVKEFSKTIDIIIKTDAPEELKNGGWVTSVGTKNPIQWAVENNFTIEGKEALQWANDTLNKELQKPTIDQEMINLLIEGGVTPDVKTLDAIIKKGEAANSLKFDGLTPLEYKEALSLANAISSAAQSPNTTETAQFALDEKHVLQRDMLKSISMPIDRNKSELFVSAVSHILADDKHDNIKLEPSTQKTLMSELAKNDAKGPKSRI